jgi:hypothetical protein
MPRGSDFAARWSEGAWAETQVLAALNAKRSLIAVQFGITDGTAFWSSKKMAERALPDQTKHGKRPDILVFRRSDLKPSERSSAAQLLFQDDTEAESLARKACLAVECEFSPYNYAHRLANTGKQLSFTIKDEDLRPLKKWTKHFKVPLGIAQIYLDSAYFLPFDVLLKGIASGAIQKKIERAYNKEVFYPKMNTGMLFAKFSAMPALSGKVVLDEHGKYTPVRQVDGGKLKLSTEMEGYLSGL